MRRGSILYHGCMSTSKVRYYDIVYFTGNEALLMPIIILISHRGLIITG